MSISESFYELNQIQQKQGLNIAKKHWQIRINSLYQISPLPPNKIQLRMKMKTNIKFLVRSKK